MWGAQVGWDVADFDSMLGDDRGFNFKFKFNRIIICHISPARLLH